MLDLTIFGSKLSFSLLFRTVATPTVSADRSMEENTSTVVFVSLRNFHSDQTRLAGISDLPAHCLPDLSAFLRPSLLRTGISALDISLSNHRDLSHSHLSHLHPSIVHIRTSRREQSFQLTTAAPRMYRFDVCQFFMLLADMNWVL
jgi:hypothetical protein